MWDKRAAEKYVESVKSEGAEEFLEMLLKSMKFVFAIDKDFRRNIENFNGRYLFCSKDRTITVAAIFKSGRLKVSEEEITDTNITVIFRNAKALMGFLLSPKPDILGSLLRQDVAVDGNLNYLYKFAFMAKRLHLRATGGL
ncbi:hypothetical protein ACFL0Q_03975 [Thermodesulfobacteriota bacterium]